MSEGEVLELLRPAVTAACDVAAEAATLMPTRARRVMWLEQEPSGHWEPAIREAKEYWLSALPKEAWHGIFTNPMLPRQPPSSAMWMRWRAWAEHGLVRGKPYRRREWARRMRAIAEARVSVRYQWNMRPLWSLSE